MDLVLTVLQEEAGGNSKARKDLDHGDEGMAENPYSRKNPVAGGV